MPQDSHRTVADPIFDLGQVTEVLVGEATLEQVQRLLSRAAATLMPSVDEAAVVVDDGDVSIAGTSDEAEHLAQVQMDSQSGPLPRALHASDLQRVQPISDGAESPQLSSLLRRRGWSGAAAVRLAVDGRRAALFVVSEQVELVEDPQRTCPRFLRLAGRLLTDVQDANALIARAEHLRDIVLDDDPIDVAMGILMARHEVGADAAGEMLRSRAGSAGLSIAETARRLVAEAEADH